MALSNYLKEPSLQMYREQASVQNPRLGMYDQQPNIYNPSLNMTADDIGSVQVNPAQAEQPEQRPVPASYPEWLEQFNPKVDLSKDIERAERDRKRHLFGNVATVLGQGLGSLIGARQFTPIQNNDNYYQQRIDQLRNLQRGYDADWAKQKLNLQLNEYQAQRNAAIAAAQAERKHEYDMALQAQKTKDDAAKADAAWERKQKEMENSNEQARLTRESQEKRSRESIAASNARNAANIKSREKISRERYGSGSNKGAVAYSSNRGNIYLNNSNDKKAMTLQALALMRDNSDQWSEKAGLQQLITDINNGNTNTLFKAEQYVSEHLDDEGNENVWNYMTNYAKRYGRVDYNDYDEDESWTLGDDDSEEDNNENGWSLFN